MTLLTKKFTERKPYSRPNPKKLFAFIPGTIVKVFVKEKEKIKKGENLLSLQAMKMNNDITSSIDGTIKKMHVKKGDVVVKNQLLVELR
ncbi:MAG: acetyl-CoA carboxylase biotin carboxyl carrier protein subunit [Bacteroidales bacterium]|nr:acetyl-CoA carboxylase biotin carboxyl carrier protein subunit [Bacteroidales bacterium]